MKYLIADVVAMAAIEDKETKRRRWVVYAKKTDGDTYKLILNLGEQQMLAVEDDIAVPV